MTAQKGFTQILVAGVIAVLVAGVGVGIYLVKQRTNIEPKAEELVQPERGITGDFAPTPGQSAIPFQIPEFLADLIPTAVPTPQPTAKPSSISPTGTTLTPTPTTVIALTSTPIPTLVPTIFPSPTQTINTTSISPTPTLTSVLTSTPVPTTASLEGQYRVSFDSNFNTLIDTGDGGIFGANSEKTISLNLTGDPGQKYVYIQFYENGSWVPAVPILASIDLISAPMTCPVAGNDCTFLFSSGMPNGQTVSGEISFNINSTESEPQSTYLSYWAYGVKDGVDKQMISTLGHFIGVGMRTQDIFSNGPAALECRIQTAKSGGDTICARKINFNVQN